MLHENTNSALNAILHMQRASFLASDTASAKVRRERIDRLIAVLMTHANDFAETMREDFGHRSPMMSLATDILGILPSQASPAHR